MSGGQATSSGINYQQRIAAWCLINQYTEFDISVFFDEIPDELIIEKTAFETDKAIDDLNLFCRNNITVFLQVKRTVSLSVRSNSEFYKVIDQFVRTFIHQPYSNDFYGLITSTDASSKITNDLKKITISLKLNYTSLRENPLSESEKDTLWKLEQIFNQCYRKYAGREAKANDFNAFVKRLFVSVVDMEPGRTAEIAMLILLKSVGFNQPELILSLLIRNSLHYASHRMSVELQNLKELFDRYLDKQQTGNTLKLAADLFTVNVISHGEFPVAKEVLLIESLEDRFDYMIVELFRFDEDCKMRNSFLGNKKMTEGIPDFTVIGRFATMVGLERFLHDNHELYGEKRIGYFMANNIDDVEDTDCAELHRTFLKSLMKKNEDPLSCLHCGRVINEPEATLIEVDDLETAAAVGNVHNDCVRRVDRVLGRSNIPVTLTGEHLQYFDYRLWVSLLIKGQGLLNNFKASSQSFGDIPIIHWNSAGEYDPGYSYCMKFHLKDGSSAYAYQRGRIQKISKLEGEEKLIVFNNLLLECQNENDPWCFLTVSKHIGQYAQMLKMKQRDDQIVEISGAEIVKYSKLIADLFDNDCFYYAPLCFLRDRMSEQIIHISNVVPMISDPLGFDVAVENWKQAGFELGDVQLHIIKSDQEFDNCVRDIFAADLLPIIDPVLDRNANLVQGIYIEDFHEIMKQKKR